jgi:hypothetical protein
VLGLTFKLIVQHFCTTICNRKKVCVIMTQIKDVLYVILIVKICSFSFSLLTIYILLNKLLESLTKEIKAYLEILSPEGFLSIHIS